MPARRIMEWRQARSPPEACDAAFLSARHGRALTLPLSGIMQPRLDWRPENSIPAMEAAGMAGSSHDGLPCRLRAVRRRMARPLPSPRRRLAARALPDRRRSGAQSGESQVGAGRVRHAQVPQPGGARWPGEAVLRRGVGATRGRARGPGGVRRPRPAGIVRDAGGGRPGEPGWACGGWCDPGCGCKSRNSASSSRPTRPGSRRCGTAASAPWVTRRYRSRTATTA